MEESQLTYFLLDWYLEGRLIRSKFWGSESGRHSESTAINISNSRRRNFIFFFPFLFDFFKTRAARTRLRRRMPYTTRSAARMCCWGSHWQQILFWSYFTSKIIFGRDQGLSALTFCNRINVRTDKIFEREISEDFQKEINKHPPVKQM